MRKGGGQISKEAHVDLLRARLAYWQGLLPKAVDKSELSDIKKRIRYCTNKLEKMK